MLNKNQQNCFLKKQNRREKMSFKRAMLISTFAIASITSSIGCVNCNAMKEELKLAYMNSKCDDGKCEKEKDDTEKKEETEKLADEKEKAKQ